MTRFISGLVKRNKLVVEGEGGRAVPARAYGKLEIDKEFIRVGCSEPDVARDLAEWMRRADRWLEQTRRDEPLLIRPHRFAMSSPSGGEWVVSTIWPSGDQVSGQGIQRRHPFMLFVVLPVSLWAPGLTAKIQPRTARKALLRHLPPLCRSIWDHLDRLHTHLTQSRSRDACETLIRQTMIPLPALSDEGEDPTLLQAASVPLASWMERLATAFHPWEQVAVTLKRYLVEHERTGGKRPDPWRLPMAGGMVEMAIWLHWLASNLDALPAPTCFFFEVGRVERIFHVIFRAPEPEDVAFLSEAPTLPLDGSDFNDDDRSFLSALAGRLSADSHTLADFAVHPFPRPAR